MTNANCGTFNTALSSCLFSSFRGIGSSMAIIWAKTSIPHLILASGGQTIKATKAKPKSAANCSYRGGSIHWNILSQ